MTSSKKTKTKATEAAEASPVAPPRTKKQVAPPPPPPTEEPSPTPVVEAEAQPPGGWNRGAEFRACRPFRRRDVSLTLISHNDVIWLFGRDDQCVRDWRKTRGLPALRLPGSGKPSYLFSLDDLIAWATQFKIPFSGKRALALRKDRVLPD